MIDVPAWLVLNIVISLLLLLLIVFKSKGSRLKMGRMYSNILICTLVLVFSDTMARVGEASGGRLLLVGYMGNFLMFLLDPVDIMFSVSYIDCWMDEKNRSGRRVFSHFFLAVVILNALALFADQIFSLHWFYYFRGGMYFRGDFFLIRAFLLEVFMILVAIYAILYRKNILAEYRNSLLVLPIFCILGALAQVFLFDLNTTYAGLAFACLILFLSFQHNDVNMDYLTGVYNRRGLDIKMQDMISTATHEKTFTAIMVDVDNFKWINDNQGHDAGDEAIKAVADILTDIFGDECVIGRYGGDEYGILLWNTDTQDIDNKIERTRNTLEMLKLKLGWDKSVGISCGYKVYDPSSEQAVKEFTSGIDALMYQEKLEHHGKRKDSTPAG